MSKRHVQYPAFPPGSSKVAVGFFGLFLSFVHTFAATTKHAVILVPYRFFVFCCWRKGVCPCEHCSTAANQPRSQPVSICLSLLGAGAFLFMVCSVHSGLSDENARQILQKSHFALEFSLPKCLHSSTHNYMHTLSRFL